MWQLIRIWGENIFSFKQIDFEIKNGVATSITGINKDNANQGSNGSGKSSLLEVIALATTGASLRSVKMDEVINDSADEALVGAQYYNPGLKKEMIIQRQISRKEAQKVSVQIFIDGKDMTEQLSKLSGVDDYNNYILNELGVSRTELFNNFLLSKYKHKSFLAASDSEKKQIINRFSNGVIVDQAIERLHEDALPVQQKLEGTNLKCVEYTAKVNALTEQLETFNEEQEQRESKKRERVDAKKEEISKLRTQVRLQTETYDFNTRILSDSEELLSRFDIMAKEAEGKDVPEALKLIDTFCKTEFNENTNYVSEISIFENESRTLKKYVEKQKIEGNNLRDKADEIKKRLEAVEDEINSFKSEKDDFEDSYRAQKIEIAKEKSELEQILTNLKNTSKEIVQSISQINNILAGAITCPKCKYEFSLETDQSVSQLEDEKRRWEAILDDKTKLKEKYEEEVVEILQKEATAKQYAASWDDKQFSLNIKLQEIQTEFNQVSKDIRQHSEAFDQDKQGLKNLHIKMEAVVTNILDEIEDRLVKQHKLATVTVNNLRTEVSGLKAKLNGELENLKIIEAIDVNQGLTNMEESIRLYRKQLIQFEKEKLDLEGEINQFKEQEEIFIQFKTHLANSKIDALSEVTNGFLEVIGSDLRVEFLGFKKLKSGKIRDKITVNLIRNGIEAGSFGKLSMGEQARILLACVLATNKLINVNCEDNKGLDLLAMDEILEGIDEDGLMSVIHALNGIGITSLIVSQLKAAENYENIIVVKKENDESVICNGE